MTVAPSPRRFLPGSRCRAGLSLLEVLIACGILALGLAGLAAMLPAAGLRLSEATITDRARFVAANAHADMLSRGLATTAACSGAVQGVAFGPLATAATGLSPGLGNAQGASLDARLFVSEDELVYDTTAPSNIFLAKGLGARAYRDSLVWGATLVPDALPAQPGGGAVLTIVVFRRPGIARPVSLTGNADGSWRPAAEADRVQFLKACSAVLLVQASGNVVRPVWLSVRASWSGGVVLPRQAANESDSIQVIGFENVVRVEHHAVTLQ